MLKAQPGASSAHELKITNLTYSRLKFALEALDVVIRDDKRVFVPAGETEGGIARSAIFDPPAIELDPGQEARVTVTLTVPGNVRFEVGTTATMPVSDQPPEFGTTVAETLPCVKTTLPGAD